MESGAVLAIPGRLGCFVNRQNAKLIPASEPRKLCAPVRSRSKQGSNGIPRMEAQMTSPLTRSVPGGRLAKRVGPLPASRIVPTTEPSALTRPSPVVPSQQENENKLSTTNLRASSARISPAIAGMVASKAPDATSAATVLLISWTPAAITSLRSHPGLGLTVQSWSGRKVP